MSQWKDEKTKIKDIFDCIRNFALCGLIFYVGIQSFLKSSAVEFMIYLNGFAGFSMVSLSLYLFFINARSFNNIVKAEHKAGSVGAIFYYLIPAFIFMLAVSLLVQTAFSLQVGDGKNVGDLTIQDLQDPKSSTARDKP